MEDVIEQCEKYNELVKHTDPCKTITNKRCPCGVYWKTNI